MPLYLCRWPNGDCSVVLASNKGAAIETLDELANAEGCPLTVLRDFMVHFRLSDSGELEFEGWGEASEEAVFEQAYPVLEETRLNVPCDKNGNLTPGGVTMIQEAVAKERQRIRPKKVKEPDTELGREIKKVTDVLTRIVNRAIRFAASKKLERFQDSKLH